MKWLKTLPSIIKIIYMRVKMQIFGKLDLFLSYGYTMPSKRFNTPIGRRIYFNMAFCILLFCIGEKFPERLAKTHIFGFQERRSTN